MLVEIRGVQFVNKGAELMLRSILEKVELLFPQATICIQCGPNSRLSDIKSINGFRRINIRKNILDFNGLTYWLPRPFRKLLLRKMSIVLEADVDVILDASGFSYGDQWNPLILRQVAQDVIRLKKHNKQYIFLPQALGPFEVYENKVWAEKAFLNADLVFARDEDSLKFLQNVGCSPGIRHAPDFTNLISPVVKSKYKHLAKQVAVIPNSKMLSTKNRDSRWVERYVDILVSCILIMQSKGESVFLLNHEGESDFDICLKINAKLSVKLEIIQPENALDVKAVIGQCKFVVCSRYHGCVSALSQQVPCIGTSWSHKYEKLFSEYQQSSLITPDISNEDLESLILDFIEHFDDKSHKLYEPAIKYKSQSEQMWHLVYSEMSKKHHPK